MKYKMLEKIPPLPAEKTKDKMRFVAEVQRIQKKDIDVLIIDIYRNLKKNIKTPMIRICITEKETANYDFAAGVWNNRNIDNFYKDDTYMISDSTVSMSEEDKKKILDFVPGDNWRGWYSRISVFQHKLSMEKQRKRDDRKYELLQERLDNMPSVPEGFYQWCEEELFKRCNYIFYKRKGRFAWFICGSCGKSYKYATEPAESFESQMAEHIIQVPRQNAVACCEKCGTIGIYKHINRKEEVTDHRICYVVQRYGNYGAAVVRYFDIYKTSKAGKIPVYQDVEVNRSFFWPEVDRVQKDYNVYNGFSGEAYWIPNNIPGIATISLKPGRLYMGNLDELKGTVLEHSGIEEYEKEYDIFKAVYYMEAYHKFHAMEMLVKLGMTRLAEKIVANEYNVWQQVNPDGKTPWEVLKIDKSKLKRLMREKGSSECLSVLQAEKELGIFLSEDLEDALEIINIGTEKLKTVLEFMSARQLVNRVCKYSGVDELSEDLCGCAIDGIRSTAGMYADYLSMCIETGHDMTSSITIYPRDLKAEHDKLVLETNEKKAKERAEETNNKYCGIAERFGELMEHYGYEDAVYSIRPAKDAGEIIMEGLTLHHCVGSNGYLQNHHAGKSIILFLRPVTAKDIPYVTIEINGSRIIQWYGRNDKKPDEEKIDRWLKKYIEMLNLGILHQDLQAKTA